MKGIYLLANTNLKKSVISLMPECIRRMLKVISGSLKLLGTERMAIFALRRKALRPAFTFQQKILHKMAFDRNTMLPIFADKVKVRQFVSESVGSKYLTSSFGEFKSLIGLNRTILPKNFVLKPNHASGAYVICWEGAPRGVILPDRELSGIWGSYIIHPDDLVWEHLVNLSSNWMKANYFWKFGKFPEWAYKDIEPQIHTEEVLTHNKKIPEDYKFFMVNGECVFIQVRHAPQERDLYTPNWELISAKFLYPKSGLRTERPIQLTEMLNLAKALATGIDFIRVDLYVTDVGIKFGELTNYPDGGLADIRPKKLSVELVKNWIQNY